jgi:hypothetical protein
MNWKTEAMEKLRCYDAMQRSLQNIPQEISRLKAESVALGSGVALVPGGSRNIRRKEDALLDNMVKRQQLQWSLEQARSWTQTVNHALSGLTPEERMILHRLYILPQEGAMEDLSEKLGVERSSVYRHRDKALRKFTLCLYGQEESKDHPGAYYGK